MHFSSNKVACISDVHLGVHQNSQTWHNIALDFAPNGYQSYENSFDLGSKSIKIGNRSLYENIGDSTTQNILLIGHTDAIEPYGIVKLKSIFLFLAESIILFTHDILTPLCHPL